MKLTNCIIILSFLVGTLGCEPGSSEQPQQSKLPVLTVGIQTSPAMLLVMVAEEKQFFDSSGVDVQIKEFTAGKFALQAFLGNSIDLAVSGDVPIVLSTLQGNKFRVITQVVERTVNECRVVVRNEEGITTAEEYFRKKKRKLSTSFGGGPEYFTYSFLKKNNLSKNDIELISQKPEEMPVSLENGSVDGISIFDPFARFAEVNLGDKAYTFADSTIYSELYLVTAMQKTIDERPEELKAFVQGLRKAQEFVRTNPNEAKEIMIKYTKLDRSIVDGIWGNFVFQVALNDLFIQFANDEVEWALSEGKFPPSTAIPNFREIVYPNILKEVEPSAVTLK